MLIANRLFWAGRIAAITLAAIFVFQICCFGQFPADNVTITIPTPDTSCHDELPRAPLSPTPAHSCCLPSHSQNAVVATSYTPPHILATWRDTEAIQQATSLVFPTTVSAEFTGPPGDLTLRI